jgi:hypothetical protein
MMQLVCTKTDIDLSVDFLLAGVTGNPADTLKVIGSPILKKLPIVTFPIEYGNLYEDTTRSFLNFIGNVPSLGLSNFPITQVYRNETITEIVGWGQIALRNPITQVVDTFETLLQHEITVNIDSFYDATNNPLPMILLAPLGRSQGEIDTFENYRFFVPELDYAAFEIVYTNGIVNFAYLNKSAFTLGIPVNTLNAKQELLVHSAYPNPIQGNQFQIDIDKNNAENWQLDIYNTLGQTVHNEIIINNISMVRLDNRLPNGQYLYTIRNENGQTVANGKLTK